METNSSVWKHYQPGYVADEYVPYLRELATDAYGNDVEVNNWKGPMPTTMVQPELVRINKGLTYMRLYADDPCALGWKKDPNNLGYCVQEPLRHEPVFYTKKAFIAKNQYFNGPQYENGVLNRNEDYRRISEQTDMRSVNPLTGEYTVYYQPLQSAARTRYLTPVIGDKEKFDKSWNLSRQSGYAKMPTADSLLGPSW